MHNLVYETRLGYSGRVIRSVSVFEAKSQLSKMIEAVESGEQVVITKHGKPVARLVPEIQRTLKFGLLEGEAFDDLALDEIDFDDNTQAQRGFEDWRENLKNLEI